MQGLENTLGEPDLQLAGLRIWIHGRQFPASDDYWDGNWMNVTVHCGAPGANVWVSGPIIHLSEIAHFLQGAAALHTSLQGEAALSCMEPELAVRLKAEDLGHIAMTVDITPDNVAQAHRFTFTIDQTYLPRVIHSCQTILQQYPVKEQL
jgi:hypothetical protein